MYNFSALQVGCVKIFVLRSWWSPWSDLLSAQMQGKPTLAYENHFWLCFLTSCRDVGGEHSFDRLRTTPWRTWRYCSCLISVNHFQLLICQWLLRLLKLAFVFTTRLRLILPDELHCNLLLLNYTHVCCISLRIVQYWFSFWSRTRIISR